MNEMSHIMVDQFQGTNPNSVQVRPQRGNCGLCELQAVYTYACSICQVEQCSNCNRAIPIAGYIYMICHGCATKITQYWSR